MAVSPAELVAGVIAVAHGGEEDNPDSCSREAAADLIALGVINVPASGQFEVKDFMDGWILAESPAEACKMATERSGAAIRARPLDV